ncbi:phage holin family protein [Candidatus Peregrinibacteria bacterium]|nr:phage holin family protein [Candidatus Peregrinibacteria bacterium]MBI3816000.1 phage holin family protein [Candidatus Peregrinibacteria bacterium]
MSAPARIIVRFVLNVLLVWGLATYLSDYVSVEGGWTAFVVIGALLTLMNAIVRPLLTLITLPLRLLATILTVVIVNGIFLWLTILIVGAMDPTVVSLQINGGIAGWIFLSLLVGLANWVMKEVLHYEART